MLTFLLIDSAKNVLDSSIDIEGLRFSRLKGIDTWSVWVQSEKLVCLASIDLIGYNDYSANAWWDVATDVKQVLQEYEHCAGNFTRFWDTLEKPLVIYD